MKIKKNTFTLLHLYGVFALLLISPFEFSHVQFFSHCQTLHCLLQLQLATPPPSVSMVSQNSHGGINSGRFRRGTSLPHIQMLFSFQLHNVLRLCLIKNVTFQLLRINMELEETCGTKLQR
ncbi:hypothetical protein LDENG_00249470 [Lucifuga dentata]|nr:hypothetical protein LDENG_00249470 [Lucifuga dentata]